MTVTELIEILLNCDENATVIVATFGEGEMSGEMIEASEVSENEGEGTVTIE